ALLLAIVALAAAAAPAHAACPKIARCGAITVPLDHSGLTPGTLPFAYSVVPATGTKTGTVVLIPGGPGPAGGSLTRDIAGALAPIRATQDIVIVDQRGTGGSGRVDCGKDRFGDSSPETCAEALGVKRPFWSTPETARDIEDLRAALGVEQITVLGVSYGTKVAAEYARRFPAHTSGLVLDSAVPVENLD